MTVAVAAVTVCSFFWSVQRLDWRRWTLSITSGVTPGGKAGATGSIGLGSPASSGVDASPTSSGDDLSSIKFFDLRTPEGGSRAGSEVGITIAGALSSTSVLASFFNDFADFLTVSSFICADAPLSKRPVREKVSL